MNINVCPIFYQNMYRKELAYPIKGVGILKVRGPARMLETQTGLHIIILKQNIFRTPDLAFTAFN